MLIISSSAEKEKIAQIVDLKRERGGGGERERDRETERQRDRERGTPIQLLIDVISEYFKS